MSGATKFSALCYACSKIKDDCTVMMPDRWICASCLKLWHEDTPDKWDGEPGILPPPDSPMENACGDQPINQFIPRLQEGDVVLAPHHVSKLLMNLHARSRDMSHWLDQCQMLLQRLERFNRLGGRGLHDFLRSEKEWREKQKQLEDLQVVLREEKDPCRPPSRS